MVAHMVWRMVRKQTVERRAFAGGLPEGLAARAPSGRQAAGISLERGKAVTGIAPGSGFPVQIQAGQAVRHVHPSLRSQATPRPQGDGAWRQERREPSHGIPVTVAARACPDSRGAQLAPGLAAGIRAALRAQVLSRGASDAEALLDHEAATDALIVAGGERLHREACNDGAGETRSRYSTRIKEAA